MRLIFLAALTLSCLANSPAWAAEAGGGKIAGKCEPVAIAIDEPFYANCIFPDEEVRQIRGTITLNCAPESLVKASLSVSLKGGDFEKTADVAMTGGKSAFVLPVGDLKVGDYVLSARLTSDGKVIASQEKRIRKLAEPEKGSCVRIDRNLNLVANGKPIFVRGWCGGGMMPEPLDKRFPHGDSPCLNIWGAAQCDLEGERLVSAEGRLMKLPVKPSQAMFDAMARVIEQNRGQPELVWYYLCDEPECRGISPAYLKHQYDFIKERDPYHPVLIITREPKQFTECADMLSTHPYISPTVNAAGERKLGTSMKNVRDTICEVYSSAACRIPAWLTPQAFCDSINSESDYPTFAEYNCSVYAAVANGAKGLLPFVYCDHFNSIDLRDGCPFICESLAHLDEFLLEHPASDPVEVSSSENGVDVWLKRKGDKLCMIAVNLLNKKVEAGVESKALQTVGELYGFREDRTVPVKDGRLSLQFEPYQVHVLTNPKMGQMLKTVATLLKEIEADKKALKKDGNILYGRGKEIEWDVSGWLDYGLMPPWTLTNGICDSLGWRDVTGSGGQTPYVEAIFTTFTPRFRKAKVYTSTVEDMDFLIWKRGEWKKVGEVKGNQGDVITFEFPETLSTVKMRIEMPKVHPDKRAEIYEIELY